MPIARGKLAEIQTLPSSSGNLLLNPAATTTYVAGFTLHNTSASPQVVTLNYVPDSSGVAGTAAASNRIYRVTLAADETQTYVFPGDGLVLSDLNDGIQGSSTNASVVTVTFFGLKET